MTESGECLFKTIADLGFGRRAKAAQKVIAVQKLRSDFKLDLLLDIAQLPRATFYYHLKRLSCRDKYETEKAEITSIYHFQLHNK